MGKLKILAAEDEKDVLEIMAKKLKAAGYAVVTALNGADAWAKIQRESPDIILLDLNMPRMDGLTVLKNLRQNPPSAKWQPVIIISARTELKDMKAGFDLEADHYLTKPFQMSDLLKAINLMEQLIPQRKSNSELKSQKKTDSPESK